MLREAHQELVSLAQAIRKEFPDRTELAISAQKLAENLAWVPKQAAADDQDSEEVAIETIFKPQLQKAQGKMSSQWWLPPHNLMVNRALMAWNFWQFSILPMWPKKKAFRPASDRYPAGIVIHPIWQPLNKDFGVLTPEIATKIVGVMKSAKSIPETVKNEVDWIARTFSVQIPSAVVSKLQAESVKVAKRRMNVDRLKVKDRLIPLDGSKPIDLPRW
jgi:hypothetical protein